MNWRPAAYKTTNLPTELSRHFIIIVHILWLHNASQCEGIPFVVGFDWRDFVLGIAEAEGVVIVRCGCTPETSVATATAGLSLVKVARMDEVIWEGYQAAVVFGSSTVDTAIKYG